MDNLKLNKLLFLLGLLVTLISLLLSVLLNWVDNDTFVKLEESIGYKEMLLILLSLLLTLLSALVYNKIFSSVEKKNIPEKICPKCGKPKLEVVNSTIRSFEYKCSNCGFEHRTLKEDQTNTIKR